MVIDNKGTTYQAWTFNGQFPGPVVRATEGDTIEFSLTNPKTNRSAHSMDFHAGEMDFLTNHKAVKPGGAYTVDVVVQHEGAYPLVTHSLTDALRGAIAVLVVKKDAQTLPLMPYVEPGPREPKQP